MNGATIRRLVVVLSVVAGSAAVSTGDVNAATGNGSCDSGEICVWSDGGFTGCMRDWIPVGGDSNWTNGSPTWNYPARCYGQQMNDQVTSVMSRAHNPVIFYRNSYPNQTSECFIAHPGSSTGSVNNLSPITADYRPNNSFSSHQTGDRYCQYEDRD